MLFTETKLDGAWIIELDRIHDERGFFARAFCANEFRDHGLEPAVAQMNLSANHARGTLRGLHYQLPPALETKLLRCVRGSVYSVIVDMRPDSPTRLQWFGAELSEDNGRAIYVPSYCANSYLTLADDSVTLYHASEFYTPGAERGLRFDDPALAIEWPITPRVVSKKDRSWPLLSSSAHQAARQ